MLNSAMTQSLLQTTHLTAMPEPALFTLCLPCNSQVHHTCYSRAKLGTGFFQGQILLPLPTLGSETGVFQGPCYFPPSSPLILHQPTVWVMVLQWWVQIPMGGFLSFCSITHAFAVSKRGWMWRLITLTLLLLARWTPGAITCVISPQSCM